jgi:GNAT superfamily N-acetyltransferase
MARSALLQRYRTDYASALQAMRQAVAEDVVLCAGEPLTGMAWLCLAPRILGGAAYLRLLLVADEAQGQGLGADLLQALETHARQTANHCYLLTTTDNAAARRFYERHGYRHVGDLPGLVWPDLDEALYHKRLRASDATT